MTNYDYNQLITRQQARVKSLLGMTLSLRRERLLQLKKMLVAEENEILKAAEQDLDKSKTEAYTSEIAPVLVEIDYQMKHLRKFSRPVHKRVDSLIGPATGKIRRMPYGSVLIISPWNYPINLALLPLAGALAAGNSCVIKPSEYAPACSHVLKDIIDRYFAPEDVSVVEGDANVARNMLLADWQYIFFTGSPVVGRKVYQAAAANMIPVTMELGGKNPCVILPDSLNMTTARRIVWGKFMNCGQTCVAPDYLLIPEADKTQFISLLKTAIQEMYGDDPLLSPDYGRLVHEKHFERIKAFLSQGKVMAGGCFDTSACKIEPTLLTDADPASDVMQEEIFGPILPVVGYQSLSAVETRLEKAQPSLVCYAFGQDKPQIERLAQAASCASFAVNHVIRHITNPALPFGGVGGSGFGRYHGRRSYETFTFEKVFYKHATWYDLKAQYPPYSYRQFRLIRGLLRWLL